MQYQQSNGRFITFDGGDGPKLYFCDPAKNTRCSKESCQKTCFHTSEVEFGLFTPEKAKLSDIYTREELEKKKEVYFCEDCGYFGGDNGYCYHIHGTRTHTSPKSMACSLFMTYGRMKNGNEKN